MGALFWAIPTRPLWPLKLSQSGSPAALATAFTRRAICDADNPNTFSSLATPTGLMASRAFMAVGVMATTAPWASTSVLERMTVNAAAAVGPAFNVAPGERGGLAVAQSGVGEHGHPRHVEAGAGGSLLQRLRTATEGTRFAGGQSDHPQDVTGKSAGLTLGFGQPAGPALQRFPHAPVSWHGDGCPIHSWTLVMAETAWRSVAMLTPASPRTPR